MEKLLALSLDGLSKNEPKFWCKPISNCQLSVNDEIYHANSGKKFIIIDIGDIDKGDIKLDDGKIYKIHYPLYKKIATISDEDRKYFFHNQEILGEIKDGSFIPDPSYFINYIDLFAKYFRLVRRSMMVSDSDRVYYNLTFMYERIFDELTLSVFNEFIRSNFINVKKDNIENLYHTAYEYGFEFYSENRFALSMMVHAMRLDNRNILLDGIKCIIFKEPIKIDFYKLEI